MQFAWIAIGALMLMSACGGGGSGPAAGAPVPAAAATPPATPPTPTPTPAPPATPAAPTPAPSTPPTPAGGDLLWGVNGHPFTAYPDITVEAQLDVLVRLGIKQYRVNLAPDGSFDGLDRLLTLAAARGLTVLPIISPDVSFERDSAGVIYARSRTLAESLTRRFAGRVPVWELGNELENFAIIQPCEMRDDGTQYPCSWGPAGGNGPLEYYGPRWAKVSAALDGMSDGAKAGDPRALRAMGTAGWGHTGAFERMKADGVEWEISVWHQYSPDAEPAMKVLAGYGKPIWITEFNFEAGSQSGEDRQAKGLTDMMASMRRMRSYGVASAAVYELLDEPYWTGFESVMGLVHLEKNAAGKWTIGRDKPAADAVKRAIAAGGG